MSIRFTIAILALTLSACQYEAERKAMSINDDWENAPKEYVCTAEQMKVVEAETKFCNENTSYFSSYCYGTAFIRQCTKRGAAQGGKSDG